MTIIRLPLSTKYLHQDVEHEQCPTGRSKDHQALPAAKPEVLIFHLLLKGLTVLFEILGKREGVLTRVE